MNEIEGRGLEQQKLYDDVYKFNAMLIHELKTPLQEIKLYSEFVEEDNIHILNTQSKNDLRSIRQTCDRMTDLIQDMMDYFHAEIKEIENNNIDLELLISQCYEEQIKSYKTHDTELEIMPLPKITADLTLFRIMITNIISNSIKYTRKKNNPKIKVYSRITKEVVSLCIKDNGIGFDMEYANHIFEPFARLQDGGKYEGNGIGLATVYKICHRFGGDITIEGVPGKGCEVKIQIPSSMLISENIHGSENERIKIGIVGDLSGIASEEEKGKYYSYLLATEEINKAGGIDGKQVELIFKDSCSKDDQTKRVVEELTEKDHVDVLMGSTLSPSRDIMRHHAYRTKTLYMNTQQTEGGVANHYTFCLSATPEHQMGDMIHYLIRKYGKKCYILAADYNYGILSAEWAKYFVRKYKGEIVGMEYIDDTISDFSSIIGRIRQLNTEVLISICVFPNHDQFYVQWYEEGMNHIPNATTQVAAEFMQNVKLQAPILENTYVMASFLEESCSDEAQDFVKKYREICSREEVPYMNMDTETVYSTLYLYKKAVEYAGSTDTEAIIQALESGNLYFDGPGGRVTVRGEDHHTSRSLTCFRIDAEHHLKKVFETEAIQSDYIEQMIERKTGIKGGIRALGLNAGDEQYNMLLDKIY